MLTLTATGAQEGARRIHLMAERVVDARPAWERVSDELLRDETQLFRTGTGLKPDKAVTVARKRRDRDPRVRGNAGETLVARGFLRDFLTSDRDQPLRATRSGMTFGIPEGRTSIYYGRFQARQGRNPVITARAAARVARPIVRDQILGR